MYLYCYCICVVFSIVFVLHDTHAASPRATLLAHFFHRLISGMTIDHGGASGHHTGMDIDHGRGSSWTPQWTVSTLRVSTGHLQSMRWTLRYDYWPILSCLTIRLWDILYQCWQCVCCEKVTIIIIAKLKCFVMPSRLMRKISDPWLLDKGGFRRLLLMVGGLIPWFRGCNSCVLLINTLRTLQWKAMEIAIYSIYKNVNIDIDTANLTVIKISYLLLILYLVGFGIFVVVVT